MSKLIALWNNIKWVLLALLIGLSIGTYTGWNLHVKHVEAAKVKGLQKVIKTVVKDVQVAAKADAKLTEKKAVIKQRTKKVKKELKQYVPETVIQTVKNSVPCPSPTLNVGAVWLLNSNREGVDIDSSEWSDAESQAPTEIGLQELSEDTAEITEQYNELAENHNVLVEAVEAFQKRQREEQGIKD